MRKMVENSKKTILTIKRESDLYPIVKKSFKDDGYDVYAEVACNYRGVDMVAEKGDEQIAIELKLMFNDHLCRQGNWNRNFFDKSYIAYPVKKPVYFHFPEVYDGLRESTRQRYNWCKQWGIGILQILPSGMIYEALSPEVQKPYRKLDLQHYVDADDDIGGLPYQKGVSEGYHELESIKKYVTANPTASWQQIFDNVSNHYSSARSMAGAMGQWRGFNLTAFKQSLNAPKPTPPTNSRLDI